MLEQTSATEAYSLFVLGLSAGAMGAVGLFARSRTGQRPSWRMPLLFAALLALMGAGLSIAQLPTSVSLIPTSLGLVWLFFAFWRSPLAGATGRLAHGVLSAPRIQAGSLLVLGGMLLTWQAYALDRGLEREIMDAENILNPLTGAPSLEPQSDLRFQTDAGQPIPVYRAMAHPDAESSTSAEVTYLRNQSLDFKVIQTGPPDLKYNCHGWVFTGGRCWIRGGTVDQILRENRYQIVSRPEPGDVAVYRQPNGEVMHTALVRALSEDGTILLESKWGKVGRFIHTATQHVYDGYSCTYYRTTRGGHLLHTR